MNTPMQPPCHEVYAIRYGNVQRQARENFLLHDIHDGMMSMDFYFWLIRGEGRNVLVDTGFSACSARQRQRSFTCDPATALARLGVAPDQIGDLILTHLHYDHAGNVDAYPQATIHVQDAEMQYATGRYMGHGALRHFFSVDDVATVLRRVYQGNVSFHDGDAVIAPGIELYKVGGHTAGLQIVRVMTQRGWVVLASDAMHYYRNYEEKNPFPGIFHVGEMMEGYRRIAGLVESDDHIVPGHDPEVARRYPFYDTADTHIYRLHEAPMAPR